MSDTQFQFNAFEHEPSVGFVNWPDGWHDVMVTAAENRPTKKEGGAMWVLTIKGLGGQVHDMQQAIYIVDRQADANMAANAKKTASAIAVCCHVPQMQDWRQIFNVPFKALANTSPRKTTRNDDGTTDESGGMTGFRSFKDRNGIDAVDVWKAMKSGQPLPQAQAQQPPAQFQPQPVAAQPYAPPVAAAAPPQNWAPPAAAPAGPPPGYVDPNAPPQNWQPPAAQPAPASAPGYPQYPQNPAPAGVAPQPFPAGAPVQPAVPAQPPQNWAPPGNAAPPAGAPAAPWGPPAA